MKKDDTYTPPTEQQRRILKGLWKVDTLETVRYFKQIYNLTALNKKRYSHENIE